ncbi:MAG: hypothetical protein GY833_22360 [Aestuariibacter sp.]|nr:hypothetical protein [Aestuariibacter sp.]|tara:strand:- start:1111 stop:1536 length:426 start_codon:yes stop_codon:yes gene_type:complete
MLPILKTIKKPRKLKSGRFDSRQELIEFISEKYFHTAMQQAEIARLCQVSETTVANLIESQELKDYRRLKDLETSERPFAFIWPTRELEDRLTCQSLADFVALLEAQEAAIFKVERISEGGHPLVQAPKQAFDLYTEGANG